MYLLDTHTVLWYLEANPKLSNAAETAIKTSICSVHIVSFWEIAIKQSLGKLQINSTITKMIAELKKQQIPILQISETALSALETLVFEHRDPFDRLLIAETMVKGWSIISADNVFDNYIGLQRLW